jgi:hypothetical protein
MRKEPIIEPFTLTKGNSDVTSQDGLDASTDFGTVWYYQVPNGVGIIVEPEDTFSVYLFGDDSAEMPATTRVRVLVKDSAGSGEAKVLLNSRLYASLKEFQDLDKMAHFDLTEPYKIYEKQYIYIETAGADATGTGGVDVTGGTNESYFQMEIHRVRQPL